MIGSIIGGIFAKSGADAQAAAATDAASKQLQASREAVAAMEKANLQARQDLSPWRSAGRAAIDEAVQLLGLGRVAPGGDGFDTIDPANRGILQNEAMRRFETDPGYQFRIAEGQKAIDRSLAARGGALSGAAVKAGIRYAGDMASGEFANYFNRLSGVSGTGSGIASTGASLGVTSANQQGNALQSGAANAGNSLIAAGNARASGYNAIGNAFNKGFSNLAGFGARAGWW